VCRRRRVAITAERLRQRRLQRAVASRGRHRACSSRRDRDAPPASHTWAALRAPFASAGIAGSTARARAVRHMCVPPAACRDRGGTSTRCAACATRPPSLPPVPFRLLYSQRVPQYGIPRPSLSVRVSALQRRAAMLRVTSLHPCACFCPPAPQGSSSRACAFAHASVACAMMQPDRRPSANPFSIITPL
jgi:hypothetical protein